MFSVVFLTCFVLYMMYRPKRRPSRLKLSQESPVGKVNMVDGETQTENPQVEEGGGLDGARDLSVVFQFNGHSFEAYEVLGLPAGSPKEEVDKAYKVALSQNDTESHEFLELAYNSILRTLV